MKIKYIKECKECDDYKYHFSRGSKEEFHLCLLESKLIEDINNFPLWCPLPDSDTEIRNDCGILDEICNDCEESDCSIQKE